jgi:hypothetical protein
MREIDRNQKFIQIFLMHTVCEGGREREREKERLQIEYEFFQLSFERYIRQQRRRYILS